MKNRFSHKVARLAAALVAGAMLLGSLTGCAAQIPVDQYGSTAALTYGDTVINLDEANLLLRMEQYYDEMFYTAYYGVQPWAMEVSEDVTMEMQVKEDVMARLVQTCVLMEHAEQYGVALTDEDKAYVGEQTLAFMEGATPSLLAATGATTEMVQRTLEHNALANLVWQAAVADANTEFDESEYRTNAVTYIYVSNSFNRADGAADTDYSAAEAAANDILARVQAGETLEEIKADEAYSSLNVNNGSYKTADTDSLSDLGKQTVDMKTGESKIYHSENAGFYVVYCDNEFDEEASEEARQSLVKDAQTKYFDEQVYGSWAKQDYTVNEKAWKTLKLAGHPVYVAEEATQAATEAETEAASSEAATEPASSAAATEPASSTAASSTAAN